ncbi:hypothetical protein EXS65_01380 [Candidatus Peribacteria bacterium]|nr:hypothetical protein [Candidatus Peribacteria bacterium]
MTVAFVVGIQTANNVHPVISETRAGGAVVLGDMNGSGVIDIADVQIAVELSNGARTPTPSELSADPNQDFVITSEDALSILEMLEAQEPR